MVLIGLLLVFPSLRADAALSLGLGDRVPTIDAAEPEPAPSLPAPTASLISAFQRFSLSAFTLSLPPTELVPTVPLGQDAFFFRRWTFGGANPDSEWIPILVRGTLEGEGHMGSDAVADVLVHAEVPPGLEELEHDSGGNLTRDSRWTYQWNLAGRLAQMTRREQALAPGIEGKKLEFTYDVDGRRTLTKVTTIVEGEEPLGQRTTVEERRMLWDGWLPVAEEISIDQTPTLRRYFVWGLDLDHTRGGSGGIGGLLAVVEDGENGRTLLPVHDGHGNITAVVNAANGHTVARHDYGPFGELIGQSGDVGASPFRYQSKYLDTETGLHYFGHRYYSSHRGRWISRDPAGEAGGWNLYAYCENDPAGRIDLHGLTSWRVVPGSVELAVTPEGRILGTVRIRRIRNQYRGEIEEMSLPVARDIQLEARLFGGAWDGLTLEQLEGAVEESILARAKAMLASERQDQLVRSLDLAQAGLMILPGWQSGDAVNQSRHGAAAGYFGRDLATFFVGGTLVRGATHGRRALAAARAGGASGLIYTTGTIATERLEAAFTGQDYHGTWGGDAMHMGLGMAFGGAGGYVAGRWFGGGVSGSGGGGRIALGRTRAPGHANLPTSSFDDTLLAKFSAHVDARHYRQWSGYSDEVAGNIDTLLPWIRKHLNDADDIAFNLDLIGATRFRNFMNGVDSEVTAFRNITHWELKTILETPELLRKTTFYNASSALRKRLPEGLRYMRNQ